MAVASWLSSEEDMDAVVAVVVVGVRCFNLNKRQLLHR